MGLIPEDIIAQILDRNDIAETIAGYIPLKRAGRNFKALCPFHHEKTASFVVNPDKQIFHCFGCGVGGNAITFVMQQEHVDFPEAARMLAEKAGVVIPSTYSPDPQAVSLKEIIYKANNLAADFFHGILLSATDEQTVAARRFLKNRQVNLDVVKKFKLGFAPEKWDSLFLYLRGKDINISAIEKAGLIVAKESRDGFYDRFRNRIIFPILDTKSRCVGFGARTMQDDGMAKYINSPETPVYTKGNHLYGLHAVKDTLAENEPLVVVEGYMDFIIPFQAGVTNMVASLGTALTSDQIRLLHRYTASVVMLYDADQAGEMAMLRSLDPLIEEGLNVRVAVLPQGEDPDSFVCKNGPLPFKEKIAQALSLFDYKLNILMCRCPQMTIEDKAKIAAEMLPTLNRFRNNIIKFSYVKRLSEVLAVSEQALLMELQKIKPGAADKTESANTAPQPAGSIPVRNVERDFLKLMLEDKGFIPLAKEEVTLLDFKDDKIRSVISHMFDLVSQGKEADVQSLLARFTDQSMTQLISKLATVEDGSPVADKEKLCRDYINRLKGDRFKLERQELCRQIKLAEVSGEQEQLEELKQKLNDLMKR